MSNTTAAALLATPTGRQLLEDVARREGPRREKTRVELARRLADIDADANQLAAADKQRLAELEHRATAAAKAHEAAAGALNELRSAIYGRDIQLQRRRDAVESEIAGVVPPSIREFMDDAATNLAEILAIDPQAETAFQSVSGREVVVGHDLEARARVRMRTEQLVARAAVLAVEPFTDTEIDGRLAKLRSQLPTKADLKIERVR